MKAYKALVPILAGVLFAASAHAQEDITITGSTAARRTGCVRGKARTAHQQRIKMSGVSTPVIARCVYSIILWSEGETSIAEPSQSGQWLPQPAPEPVARTKAPHKMTATLYQSTNHA